jgi:ceramide glucosyltransferase
VRFLPLLFLPAAVYQLLAIAGGLLQLLRRSPRPNLQLAVSVPTPDPCSLTTEQPGISVLKPVHGLDPDTPAAFRSQAAQDYPCFELLFGVKEANDPAIAEIARLKTEFPNARIRLLVGGDEGRNGKVGLLRMLARHAQHPTWVVNDSDIRVSPSYLSEVVAPLGRSSIGLELGSVGLVTCLYRPVPHSLPAAWEALGIATDFIPSTLVAPMLGVREFGLGSTLAFRADDLAKAGGFGAISDYLADDYQLGRHIARLGKRAVLSTYVVETSLGDDTWQGVWQHQLRWARTIRLSKGKAYAGLPITHAGLWACLAMLAGWTWAGPVMWSAPVVWIAPMLLALRWLSALITGWLVLRSPVALAGFLLTPVWDLFAFLVWLSSYLSNRVEWRGRTFEIGPDGRILTPEITPVESRMD